MRLSTTVPSMLGTSSKKQKSPVRAGTGLSFKSSKRMKYVGISSAIVLSKIVWLLRMFKVYWRTNLSHHSGKSTCNCSLVSRLWTLVLVKSAKEGITSMGFRAMTIILWALKGESLLGTSQGICVLVIQILLESHVMPWPSIPVYAIKKVRSILMSAPVKIPVIFSR